MAMTQNDAALLFWENTDALGLEHPPQPMDSEFCSSPTFCSWGNEHPEQQKRFWCEQKCQFLSGKLT
jgi:hypothetical protein